MLTAVETASLCKLGHRPILQHCSLRRRLSWVRCMLDAVTNRPSQFVYAIARVDSAAASALNPRRQSCSSDYRPAEPAATLTGARGTAPSRSVETTRVDLRLSVTAENANVKILKVHLHVRVALGLMLASCAHGSAQSAAPRSCSGVFATSAPAVNSRLEALHDVVGLTGGHLHTCALLANGATRCWGALPMSFPAISAGIRGPNAGSYRLMQQLQNNVPIQHHWDVVDPRAFAEVLEFGSPPTRSYVGYAVDGQFLRSDVVRDIDLSSGAASVCLRSAETLRCADTWSRNPVLQVAVAEWVAPRVLLPNVFCARAKADPLVRCWSVGSDASLGPLMGTLAGSSLIDNLVGTRDKLCAKVGSASWCWLLTTQLADGSWQPQIDPTPTRQIVSGADFVCMLGADGSVRCSGRDSRVTRSTSEAPAVVAGLPRLTSLSSGVRHVCGLTEMGIVFCWGEPSLRRLGDQLVVRGRRHAVILPGRARHVAVGRGHSCAQLESGEVYCWGLDAMGECSGRSPSADGWTNTYSTALMSQPVPVRFMPAQFRRDESLQIFDEATCVCSAQCRCCGVASTALEPLVGTFTVPSERPRINRPTSSNAPRLDEHDLACMPALMRAAFSRTEWWSCTRDDVLFAQGVRGIQIIACGDTHRCAVTQQGEVICGGDNEFFASEPLTGDALAPRVVQLFASSIQHEP